MAGPRRVVVVGGGISGLVTAYRLIQTSNGTPIEVTVVEASRSAGGKLRTSELAGIPIEEGADSFVVRKPWAIDLCRELGLGEELVAPAPARAYVWARGGLRRYPEPSAFGVPASVEELLRWPGLSRGGRVRAATDLLRPKRRDEGDESIEALATRRMGPEAARVLIGPLLAGIHAGDAAHLGVAATFPELQRWERAFGSLIRGARAAAKAAREREDSGPMFATVWTGLSDLVEVLTRALGADRIRTGEFVEGIEQRGRGWAVRAGAGTLESDALVLATPAFESSRLLRGVAPEAAAELGAIPYASTAVILLVYPPGTAEQLPPGSGFIVPPAARDSGALSAITASTWVSSKWPRAEHAGRAVIRCYVGRFGDDAAALERSDQDLAAAAARDLEAASPLGCEPEATRVVRWPRSMPQYEVGHLDRLAGIDGALSRLPGLFLVGSAYRGVGVADCVRQGGEASERVRAFLAAPEGTPPGDPGSAGNGADLEQEAIT